jgi:aspartyl-tRNA(Asn)/glutamyl-tRNA(Gln) amidotransferase subunit B
MGMPGVLPVPNREAIRKTVLAGIMTNCEIARYSKFDRKNYFYPDLPKGYQISQNQKPFAYNGKVELEINGEMKQFRINRVHMEEDAGKSIHHGELTLLDFNKSGMPLIEIVTEPDFRSVDEVNVFATRLRQIVRYVGVSDANMERGQMRFELNISLRERGKTDYPPYKVEVKNIGSISVLEKVIKFEIERQKAILESGNVPIQETRGLKDMSGETLSQRVKEDSDDYRYFPEPDLPPVTLTDEYIDSIRKTLPELPEKKKHRYMNEYGISSEIAENIVSNYDSAVTFEDLINGVTDKESIQEIDKDVESFVRGVARV